MAKNNKQQKNINKKEQKKVETMEEINKASKTKKNKRANEKNTKKNNYEMIFKFFEFIDKYKFAIYGAVAGILVPVFIVIIICPDRIAKLEDMGI